MSDSDVSGELTRSTGLVFTPVRQRPTAGGPLPSRALRCSACRRVQVL